MVIETQRLILREWVESDKDPFIKLNQDHQVIEFLPAALSPEETIRWVDRIHQHFAHHGFGLWATTRKDTGEFIGYVGLSIPNFTAHFTPCVEIGWRLSSKHWGFGFATEAAKQVLDYGFSHLGLSEIVSFTVPLNNRSIRVMEKIGLIRDVSGDFLHPFLPSHHPLAPHILYRKRR